MKIIKWFCFVLVCLDLIKYVSDKLKQADTTVISERLGASIGITIGILARTFLLYGAATCWLLN